MTPGRTVGRFVCFSRDSRVGPWRDGKLPRARTIVADGRNIFTRSALGGRRREATEDVAMRKLLLGLVPLAAVAVMVAAPAQSQVYVRPAPGVEVDIGGRHHYDDDWRYRHRYDRAYGSCRVIRERIETPSGRVIFKTRREC